MFHAQLEVKPALLVLEAMKLNYILKKLCIPQLGVTKQKQSSYAKNNEIS